MTASPDTASRPRWRRFLANRAVWALLALLLIIGGGYMVWRLVYGQPSLREQYQFATVQRADIQDLVTATGTVQPRDYVDVGAQVSGQLKRLHVEVGSIVKAGDLLAEIDPTVLTATVDARRAGLRNQRATLAERESQYALAQLLLSRQRNLMKDDATTTESLQQAEATSRAAKAQIDAIKATIEQTESTLRADEANLNYAKIYAPLAGTVVSVTARQGQTLNANQSAPTILRIADLSTMTVQTQVSEADVSKLRQDMTVYFTTLGSQGRRWYGTLRKVEPTPTVTNNVVLYNALFDVPNNNQALMTNMTAQVFFIAAEAKDALVVPVAAIGSSSGGAGRAGGARRERGETERAASAPAEGASVGERGASSTSAPMTRAAETAEASRSAPSRGGPLPERFANMSREERRAAFEAMSPEERQALREQRQATGGRAGGDAARAPAAAASAAPSSAVRAAVPRVPSAARAASAAAPSAASGPTIPATGGFATIERPRGTRRSTVKVLTPAGTLEERSVELGVSNRVQVQVLSGLNEGEQVVAGIKQQQTSASTQRAAGQQGGGLQQAPAGMPPGMGQAPRGR
ncbi:efflux RND transporter periplasmic adaptor subunit [Methylibium sp. Root1272]|uniref:efflux RND transporter periplasmic adaptor subunit n=1 Tax=Methylibium sp. Root1272 TaxID=1736441 RepID=UPI000701BE2D|nr:efflux RND transporter periplasmic adaptor subunit [Methylibium sp. Root1272]KQW68590.1 secretion protein [Methylibium sp. Root1272]